MTKKYGKKELKIISEVLNNFDKIKKINRTSTILYTSPIQDAKRSYIGPTYSDYIMFGLYKILQDNFDEEFIKEKIKR